MLKEPFTDEAGSGECGWNSSGHASPLYYYGSGTELGQKARQKETPFDSYIDVVGWYMCRLHLKTRQSGQSKGTQNWAELYIEGMPSSRQEMTQDKA
jgi:hypothetical protein